MIPAVIGYLLNDDQRLLNLCGDFLFVSGVVCIITYKAMQALEKSNSVLNPYKASLKMLMIVGIIQIILGVIIFILHLRA
ncbi:MAG: hypothetical protein PHW04_10885 [Candidatus Wallbacteria bacterium]|nr:hypothetical protein [Candidatus Wallbacteria bacterium]